MPTLLQDTTSAGRVALWEVFEAKATALACTVVHADDEPSTTRMVADASDGAVCRAVLAVAETGSLLVSVPNAERRAALLADRLWLLVRAEDIVPNLDDALARLGAMIAAGGSPYATFMSGPSRTADIERTLTIGAHGPRELTIVVTGQISA